MNPSTPMDRIHLTTQLPWKVHLYQFYLVATVLTEKAEHREIILFFWSWHCVLTSGQCPRRNWCLRLEASMDGAGINHSSLKCTPQRCCAGKRRCCADKTRCCADKTSCCAGKTWCCAGKTAKLWSLHWKAPRYHLPPTHYTKFLGPKFHSSVIRKYHSLRCSTFLKPKMFRQ